MKWMFFVMFATGMLPSINVDVELFRFYTKEECEIAKQYLYKAKDIRDTHLDRRFRGTMVVTDCFSEDG